MATVLVEPDREFEELYRRHAADVHRYALAVSQNEVDAEDVTQQTFMNAYRALVRGEQPRAPLHWLIAIAHNVVRERLRRSSRRPTEVALEDNLRAAAPEEARWSAEEIRQALTHLCPKQRAVMVLRELGGRPYAEIAQSLGLSRSATEALAFRARRALREQLESELTCEEAQAAVPRALEGVLSPGEHGALRAHLRACDACAGAARSRRGRPGRRLGSLAFLPFPLPLKSLVGSGSASAGAASAGGGVAVKAAAVAAAAAVVATGVGYETVRHAAVHHHGGSKSGAVFHRSSSPPAPDRASMTSRHAVVRHASPVAARRPARAAEVRRHSAPARRHEGRSHPRPPVHPKAASAAPAQLPASDDTLATPASKPTPKPHVLSKPKPKSAPGSKHDTAPRQKPAKHEHVQKTHQRGHSADAPGHARGVHEKAVGNGSGGTHGKGKDSNSEAETASPDETVALPPPPPDQAASGNGDG